jgi:RES domain-containing protein
VSITAWRIAQRHYVADAFAGEGAARWPGRWNARGVRMVYTAVSLSLAALEMLVHLDRAVLLRRYVGIPVTFDEALCSHLPGRELPDDWAASPAPVSTRLIGTQWVEKGQSVVLAVPSVIVPREVNYLLNPAHADFGTVEIGAAEEFGFDARLFGGK